MDFQNYQSLVEAYTNVYEERRSPEERKKRAKELGDRQREAIEKEKAEKKEPKKSLTKEEVISYLMGEGYVSTEQSAEVFIEHMSDEWIETIVEATAMAKRGHDENAIRTKIAKNTNGGKFADKATALANKDTYNARGTDKKARETLARKQRKDFRDTTSSNPGLHGYPYYSKDPAVKAKQNARGLQRGTAALTPSEKKHFGS